ncbi:MAG: transcriptional regulator NrdR [Candidatus Anoxymicrobium japonicum]|uniref:Transcriptional repressor NrdR n=1 Tax=Candidatus Anoxymicrobium japonicum TaxID=2013648 RepID=A0A2N3G8B3_9ACTN|nr:MAG: transcriptional regulator NrdR [Candidatus Anoxymicrobium japonicum]
MKCPFCENNKTKVIDTRVIKEGDGIRRRRCCPSCGHRFTTFERREKVDALIVKRDGALESYDRTKIANGFYKALSKRNVALSIIENNIDEMESALMRRKEKTIQSCEIGDMVMERLRMLDEIAYLRFASVYKRFGDVSEFQKEFEDIMPTLPENHVNGETAQRSGR